MNKLLIALAALVATAFIAFGGGENTINPGDVWESCITARYADEWNDYDGEDFDAWVESAGYDEDFCIDDTTAAARCWQVLDEYTATGYPAWTVANYILDACEEE